MAERQSDIKQGKMFSEYGPKSRNRANEIRESKVERKLGCILGMFLGILNFCNHFLSLIANIKWTRNVWEDSFRIELRI